MSTGTGGAGVTARVDLDVPDGAVSLLVLGHGAGGDVTAPDLSAVRDAALASGMAVARVTQPYRVAGRRAPPAAPRLDEAWIAACGGLPTVGPLIVGGRSSGARVACRTARAVGAVGIVALAFPLHAPGRRSAVGGADRATPASRPRTAAGDRSGELLTGLPTLVVNGDRDPFGIPDPAAGIEVRVRPGERHDLRRDPAAIGEIVADWLRRQGWAR